MTLEKVNEILYKYIGDNWKRKPFYTIMRGLAQHLYDQGVPNTWIRVSHLLFTNCVNTHFDYQIAMHSAMSSYKNKNGKTIDRVIKSKRKKS